MATIRDKKLRKILDTIREHTGTKPIVSKSRTKPRAIEIQLSKGLHSQKLFLEWFPKQRRWHIWGWMQSTTPAHDWSTLL